MSDLPTVLLDDLDAALGIDERLVAGVRPEQWSAATPCTEWDVRQLVEHLTAGNVGFAALVRGDAPTPAEAWPRTDDLLGDDPAGAFTAAARDVSAAFHEPGAGDRTVTVPFGTVPTAVALQLRLAEIFVHGWDLARATGQAVDFAPEAVERNLAFSAPALDQVPPGRSPFGSPVEVPEGASAIDRLAGLLGRTGRRADRPTR